MKYESFLTANELVDWINDHKYTTNIVSIITQSSLFYVFYWQLGL